MHENVFDNEMSPGPAGKLTALHQTPEVDQGNDKMEGFGRGGKRGRAGKREKQ